MKQMREQMPGFIGKVDDPWGIGWRITNAIKRFSLRRNIRFLVSYMQGTTYERPVFVIGAPRSGTTMLFQLLQESFELTSLPGEGHDMWRTFHHPRKSAWRSDAVGANDIFWGERRFINAYMRSFEQSAARRFVEKTPENCLRIPYLAQMFPDAVFIIIKRDPCDVISSLINGWRHPLGQFRSYFVPQDLAIPGYPHRRMWCFPLIDSWREISSNPIPDIAFAQWKQCTEAMYAASDMIPASQWQEFFFEDLIAKPQNTARKIYEHAGIKKTPALEKKLHDLLLEPVNALSPPQERKWLRENRKEITALLPRISPVARRLGYFVDKDTGQCQIVRNNFRQKY